MPSGADLRIPGPGAALDREVAARIGEPCVAYSTDRSLADQIIGRLAERGILAAQETIGRLSCCVLSSEVAGKRERVASGSGETSSLALCRAVVNLPAWVVSKKNSS